MPLAIAVIGFLVLLGLSGGIEGGLAPQSNASTTVEREVSRSTPARSNNERTSLSDRFDNQFRRSGEVQGVSLDTRLPSVETLAARNLESTSATVRGSAMLRTYKDGVVFVVYGYNEGRVELLAKNYRSTNVAPTTDDRAQVLILDRRANGSEAYERRVSNLAKDTQYYFKICTEYQTLAGTKAVTCGSTKTFVTNPTFSVSNDSFRTPRISLRAPLNITDSEASFSGQVTMNDGVDGIPFLVYGESESLVRAVSENNRTFSSVREDDEELQKVRIATGLRGQYEFTLPLDGLDNGQQYFYRACVEYDGERDGLVCDSVRNFVTDGRDRSNKPTATTGTVTVSGTRATITGSADMEDFFDGVAFFVYGTDRAGIEGVVERGSFARISQSIDRLQRVSVDDDLDGRDSFTRTISDLLPGTTYHYRMCVQYEDQDDRGRDTFFLRCGTTQTFTSGQ